MGRAVRQALRVAVSLYSWSSFVLLGAVYVLVSLPVLAWAGLTRAERSRWVGRGNVIFYTLYRRALFFASTRVEGWDRYQAARAGSRALIVVSNHVSLIDMVVFIPRVSPFFSFAKASFRRVPVMGLFMALSGNLFLPEHDAVALREVMEVARRRLRGGETLFLFPEGTRRGGRAMNPFKPGAFRLAVETGTPVLPVAIWGTDQMVRDRAFLVTRLPPYRFEVRVGEPIDPAACGGDAETLRARAEAAVAALLKEAE